MWVFCLVFGRLLVVFRCLCVVWVCIAVGLLRWCLVNSVVLI